MKVGLLGSSGLVGQTYKTLIEAHPDYELTFAPNREELRDPSKAKGCRVIFSALPSVVAQEVDPLYAEAGFPVFASASCHRMEEDIPLILPEVNPHHFALIEEQQRRRGWKGFIVAKPNCTLQGMLLPLFPLHQKFVLKEVSVTYLQSRSGAGKDFELEENVLPYIAGEEEKTAFETRKILDNPSIAISAQSFRVPVQNGHLADVSARFEEAPSLDEVQRCWDSFSSVEYIEDANHPQPALDLGEGMAVKVGRLRTSQVMDIRFVALSHNLIRGAAGGGLLTADTWSRYATPSLSL